MRWSCLLLLLVACEDSSRSKPRPRDEEDVLRAYTANAKRKLAAMQAAQAQALAPHCPDPPPACLPETGMVDASGHDVAPELWGNVVLIDYCPTTIPACADERAALEEAVRAYRGRAVTILGFESEDLDPNPLVIALDDVVTSYPVLPRVESFGTPAETPMSYVYDKHSRLRETHLGAWDAQALTGTIERLLNEP